MPPSTPDEPVPIEPGTTGRLLVLLDDGADARATSRSLARATGVRLSSSADLGEEAPDPAALESGAGLYLDTLNVVVIEPEADQVAAVASATGTTEGVLAVEPERIVYAIEQTTFGYVQGFRDGVDDLAERVLALGGAGAVEGEAGVTETFVDTDTTWGLKATGVVGTTFTGKGVKVAVLDTGFDAGHPDFVGRSVTQASFITGETADDGHGHGTHCIGTACGPRQPQRLPAYGVASEAAIFAGKVLSNQGRGADGGILAGIDWAIRNQCVVISMSLGAPTTLGGSFSTVYETVARARPRRGQPHRGCRRERQFPAGTDRPREPPRQLSVDHRRRGRRRQLGHRPVLVRGDEPPRRAGGHRRPGRGRHLQRPPPPPLRHHERHQYGHPARGRAGGTARAGQSGHEGRGARLAAPAARRMTLPNRDVGAGLAQAPGAVL